MKTQVIILAAIGLFSLNSCMQETNPLALMATHESRNELYNAIAQNDSYMTEFMANLQNEENAMKMMQDNNKIIGAMKHGENMQMTMQDSTAMHAMMATMMNDGKMMGTMMKMMHEKGIMSENCMESCKNMMGEKGMNLPAGKAGMQNMNNPTKEDHNEHH